MKPEEDTSSSFTTTRLNSSTFLITEDDSFNEHPCIYAKLHPSAPILILNDTGCNSPSASHAKSRFIHLRDYLENCPVANNNNNRPLNPGPNRRHYVIICSHCHYDHTLGLPQFQEEKTTQIIASAQGRDFIESDLATHGLFSYLGLQTPEYTVTHWAQSFEQLHWSSSSSSPATNQRIDLGITLIPTPGHTPDSLAWYDHAHMHLYVGDSLYEEGPNHTVPIIWPPHGNMIDWYYSMSKLLQFAKTENARARETAAGETVALDGGWEVVERRVRLAAGHQTSSGDAEVLIEKALRFLGMVLADKIPARDLGRWMGEKVLMWRLDGYGMYFSAPVRLVDEAKLFFGGEYVV